MPAFRFFLLVLLMGAPAAAMGQAADGTLAPLPLHDLRAFRPAAANWRVAGDVVVDRGREHDLSVLPGTGVLVNLPDERRRDNLFTAWVHGDLELELDVLMPRGSNSGVYLMGRYEVQLLDSWNVPHPRFSDIGGLYQRWDDARGAGREGYEGHPPRLNAARAPGLWQHLRIRFEAPRFDAAGRKVADARFVEVVLNGVTLHEDVAVTGPTRAAAFEDERPTGPLMIQGDHGPVAFRNIRYKRYGEARAALVDVRYSLFSGRYDALPDLAAGTPVRTGSLDGFRTDVVDFDTFAVAFEGLFHAPTAGAYRFSLDLDWMTDDPHFSQIHLGGGALRVGDAEVLQHRGAPAPAEGTVELAAGAHPLRLVYYKHWTNNWGPRSRLARLGVEGPDAPFHLLNAPGTVPAHRPPSVLPVPVGGTPYVLRSMVRFDGVKRTHAVSVGDPAGVHYALDLDQGALLYAWKGPFVDAAPMWEGRGSEQVAVPLGSVVRFDGAPAVARLADSRAPWPTALPEEGYHLEGYSLGPDDRPTFRYRVGDVSVHDHLAPGAGGLVRTLTLEGPAGQAWVRLAAADVIEALPDGAYAVGDRAYYLAPGEHPAAPVLRTTPAGQELLVPVRLGSGAVRLSYSLIW